MAISAGNRTTLLLMTTNAAKMIGSFQSWFVQMEGLVIFEFNVDSFR
jgi:hypothetical protein